MSDLRYPTASPGMVKDIMNEVLVLKLDDFNDTIEVIVAKGKKELRLQFPSKVLALHSEYFRVKIRNYSYLSHTDRQPLIFDLSDQDTDALEAFFAWNRTGNILCAKRIVKVPAYNSKPATTRQLDKYRLLWDQLLECYFLADFLGAPDFGNSAIDTLLDIVDHERVYRNNLPVVDDEVETIVFPLQPTLEADDNDNNQDFDQDNDNDGGNQDFDTDGFQNPLWRELVRDPFEKNISLEKGRQMLGTMSYQIQRLYSKTNADSPLRRMFVDKIIREGVDHFRRDGRLHLIMEEPALSEFYQDLVGELMRTTSILSNCIQGNTSGIRADHRARYKCFYHKHKAGEHCKKHGLIHDEFTLDSWA